MILSQIELNSFNRGREVGLDEAKEKWKKEGFNEAIKVRANVLKKQNPDLTDEEAFEIAKKEHEM